MRTLFLAGALLALGWTPAVPAFAQNAPKYDPIMAKRTDLRMQWMRGRQASAMPDAAAGTKNKRGKFHVRSSRHQAEGTETPLIRAQGSPYFVDLQALSNKRADLRMDVARHGFDAAFTDWLRHERPFAYRQYLSDQGR